MIDGEEPEFEFDEHGNVRDVHARAQTESHSLIEHLMIAANEAVAELLEQRAIPCLYRVHERPDPQRIERLVAQLASLEVPTPPVPEPLAPAQAADLLGEISRLVERHVRRTGRGAIALESLVLRSLKQAYYSPRNLGHAGLHSPRYCHFTSPIRRYPDVVCHRALLSTVGGGEHAPRASALGELGEWTSERERDAARTERDADDIARCFVLERVLYDAGPEHVFAGEIAGLIGAGAFVAFGEGGAREELHRALGYGVRGHALGAGAAGARQTASTAAGAAARRAALRRERRAGGRARVVGAQRGGHDPARRAHRRERAARRRRQGARDERRHAARTGGPRARRLGSRAWRRARASARWARATWRRTAMRPIATTCSSASRCGIALEGTEVKALRTSGAQLKDGYAAVRDGELWLHSVHIPPYGPAARENHDPERPRKLLLHRRELDHLAGRANERGLTLVPTRIYFSGPHAKVEIALARGKDLYDKRQTIRDRETRREVDRALREARR